MAVAVAVAVAAAVTAALLLLLAVDIICCSCGMFLPWLELITSSEHQSPAEMVSTH